MFNHPKERKDEALYADVMSVSAYKPLAYMEHGEFEDKEIRPSCLAYIPRRILDSLLKKDDIYIITTKSVVVDGKTIESKSPPKNDRLILTEKNESNGTHVFHLPSLLDLLQMNRGIVIRELNMDSLIRNKTMPFKPPITNEIVIKFVELVSRKKQWTEESQALIDACFADPSFLKSKVKDKIKLTQALEKTFDAIKDIDYEAHYSVIRKLR